MGEGAEDRLLACLSGKRAWLGLRPQSRLVEGRGGPSNAGLGRGRISPGGLEPGAPGGSLEARPRGKSHCYNVWLADSPPLVGFLLSPAIQGAKSSLDQGPGLGGKLPRQERQVG